MTQSIVSLVLRFGVPLVVVTWGSVVRIPTVLVTANSFLVIGSDLLRLYVVLSTPISIAMVSGSIW